MKREGEVGGRGLGGQGQEAKAGGGGQGLGREAEATGEAKAEGWRPRPEREVARVYAFVDRVAVRIGWLAGWPPASALGVRSMGWAGPGIDLKDLLACVTTQKKLRI